MKRKDKKYLPVNAEMLDFLSREEMDDVYGSGNSQVRFIPDEYLQARIIKDGRLRLHG